MATLTMVPASVVLTPGTMTLTTTPGPPGTPQIPAPPLDQYAPSVQDFGFASLTDALDDSSVTIAVDDVSQFPSNAALAKAPLWLTIESELLHPPTFEIVKLTSVGLLSSTLTVERGQLGSVAQAHDADTMIKGALTAEMVKHFRAAFTGERLPPPNSEVFRAGDRHIVPGSGEFRYAGSAAFSQSDFTGASSTNVSGGDHLGPANVNTDSGVFTGEGYIPWAAVQGAFGTPSLTDGREPSAAIVTAVDGDRAVVLLDTGSPEHQIAYDMTLGALDVDAGVVFGMTPDGLNGWYCSLTPGVPPTVSRMSDGVLTSLGTIGSNSVVPGDSVLITVCVYDDVIRAWFKPAADWVSSYADFAVEDPRGGNVGLMVNSADAVTDPTLCWDDIESYMPIGLNIPRGMYSYFSFTTSDNVDLPDTVEVRANNQAVEPWSNLIGTFGIITNSTLAEQQAQYVSGAVDAVALLGTDFRSRDFDVTVGYAYPTDVDSIWGFWLRGSQDGQNGLFLSIGADSTWKITPVIDGALATAPLGSGGDLPEPVSGVANLRIVCSGKRLLLYSADLATREFTYNGGLNIPPLYDAFGGTWFGFRLTNDSAESDATLGLQQFIVNSQDYPSGWVPQPSYEAEYNAPVTYRPFGSLFYDASDGSVYVSKGVGGQYNWAQIAPQFFSGPPWTTPRQYAWAFDLVNNIVYIGNNGQWQQIGASSDTPPSDPFRGVADMGFFGDAQNGTPSHGDFWHASGAKYLIDYPDASVSFGFIPWPDDGGTNFYWLAVGAASLDGSGTLSLTDTSDESVGAFVYAPDLLALPDLHIKFDATIPDAGSGFAFGILDPSVLVFDSGNDTNRRWTGTDPLSTGSGSAFGAGGNDGAYLLFGAGDSISFQCAGDTGGSTISTFTVPTGTHTWDIRFQMSDGQNPVQMNMYLYCDGTRVGGNSFIYNLRKYYSGTLFFSGETTVGASGAVTIGNLEVFNGDGQVRVRDNYAVEPLVPLRLLNNWTEADHAQSPAMWSIDGSNIRLYGAVKNDVSANYASAMFDLNDGNLFPRDSTAYLPVAAFGVGGFQTRHITCSFTELFMQDYQASDVIYLDSVVYRRSQ